jgi:ribosomal protein S18 acetylase RimI-like enzyme
MPVEIRRSRLEDAPSFSEAVSEVAAEQWYLATVDGYSSDQTRAYIQTALTGSVYQVVAVDGGNVIGACDVRRSELKGFAHVGQLGMYVRKAWRGRGIGRKLLSACLSVVKQAGLEKIELEVFADNIPAIRLYESTGFLREGLKERGRKWHDRYQDVVLMALWL